MNNIFKKLNNEIVRLNTFLKEKPLSENDILDGAKNYQNFLIIIDQLKNLIATLENLPAENIKENNKILFEIHKAISDIEYYILNLDENLLAIMRFYPHTEIEIV